MGGGWPDTMLKVDEFAIHKICETSEPVIAINHMFPEATAQDLARMRPWYWTDDLHADPEKANMRIFLHSYLLQADGKNILIDTCLGNHKRRDFTPFSNLDTEYLKRFYATGIAPEEIDYVMCTHLHVDHVGWNTRLEDGRWVPTFPNARYLFNRTDYSYFASLDEGTGHDHYSAWKDSILPVVERGLADVIDTGSLVEHGLSANIWVEAAPGHTPGNCTIHCGKGSDSQVIFTGDTFHHPVQLARPSICTIGDFDWAMATATRAAFFNRYADTDSLIFPAHFGGSSGGRIRRQDEAYRMEFLDPSAWL